jgi:hypothetical protein
MDVVTLDEELAAILKYAAVDRPLGHLRYLESKAEIKKLQEKIDKAVSQLDAMLPQNTSSPIGVGGAIIGKKIASGMNV